MELSELHEVESLLIMENIATRQYVKKSEYVV